MSRVRDFLRPSANDPTSGIGLLFSNGAGFPLRLTRPSRAFPFRSFLWRTTLQWCDAAWLAWHNMTWHGMAWHGTACHSLRRQTSPGTAALALSLRFLRSTRFRSERESREKREWSRHSYAMILLVQPFSPPRTPVSFFFFFSFRNETFDIGIALQLFSTRKTVSLVRRRELKLQTKRDRCFFDNRDSKGRTRCLSFSSRR